MHLDEYLAQIILRPGGELLRVTIGEVSWEDHEDEFYHGALVYGEPTQEDSKELLRVLKPGAHTVLIPDQGGGAYQSVCALEDTGFEVRDAIYYAEDPEGFQYVAKASRTERGIGCAHLPMKTGAESVSRKEGSAGLNSPRAGAGRTASEVRNFHPTTKSIGIMEWCLRGIRQGEQIVDPFAGSGTTLIAATRFGINAVGIELSEDDDYGPIIDGRVRHWANHDYFRDEGTRIDSEFEPKEVPEGNMTLDDLFFGGDVSTPVELRNKTGQHHLKIWKGNCVERMKDIDTGSVDAVICDPPYGLKFQGKKFDNIGEGSQQREWHRRWLKQAYRILKSGGLIRAFCGTRTQHHLLRAMEQTGFVGVEGNKPHADAWKYGSGFPKSLNVHKELVTLESQALEFCALLKLLGISVEDSDPVAVEWEGWGTALKPAWEPICTARKP